MRAQFVLETGWVYDNCLVTSLPSHLPVALVMPRWVHWTTGCWSNWVSSRAPQKRVGNTVENVNQPPCTNMPWAKSKARLPAPLNSKWLELPAAWQSTRPSMLFVLALHPSLSVKRDVRSFQWMPLSSQDQEVYFGTSLLAVHISCLYLPCRK